jgi:coenzyme F420 hydrogenase subunit beta
MSSNIQSVTNIKSVVASHLCTSCGACAGICPNGAIEMRLDRFGVYVPYIRNDLCTHCGLCVHVCPGHGFDYFGQHQRLHGTLDINATLGPYLGTYVGHATDEGILHHSQSGGFVSTLLIFCLENRLIDGAIVTRWRQDSPLEPQTYIARKRGEILAAVGSKYNPIPTCQVISKILKESGRFAFVGTSCQIQGMRKAEEVFIELADKIALYIGLHCVGVFTYYFHDQILHKLGLSGKEVKQFRHKDKSWRGWPCDMRIEDIWGRIHNVDRYESRHWPGPYFTNWRCRLCFDKANEFSDISCGDCRIPSEHHWFEQKGYDLKKGISEFVVRTERGQNIVNQVIKDGRFIAHAIDADSVGRSIGVAGKKLGLNTFDSVAKMFYLQVPDYGVRFSLSILESSLKWRFLRIWAIVYSSRYYVIFALSRYASVRWILKRIPHRWLGWLNAKLRSQVEWFRFGSSECIMALHTKKKKGITDKKEKAISCSTLPAN